MVSKVPGGTTRVSLGRLSARLLASRSTAGAKEPTWTGRVVVAVLGTAFELVPAFKLRGRPGLAFGESLKNQVFASRGGTGSEAAILRRTSGTFVIGRTRTACCTSRTSASRTSVGLTMGAGMGRGAARLDGRCCTLRATGSGLASGVAIGREDAAALCAAWGFEMVIGARLG